MLVHTFNPALGEFLQSEFRDGQGYTKQTNTNYSKIKNSIYCMYVSAPVWGWTHDKVRGHFVGWFSPSALSVLGIKLKSTVLMASAFQASFFIRTLTIKIAS